MAADPKAWLRSKLKEHAQENQTAKNDFQSHKR